MYLQMIDIALWSLKQVFCFLDAFSARICFACKQDIAAKRDKYFCLNCLTFLQQSAHESIKQVEGKRIFYALEYEEFIKKYMRDFKYRNPFLLLFWMAQLEKLISKNFALILLPEILSVLEENYKQGSMQHTIYINLLAIPMHLQRKQKRKYNQAELLAKHLAINLQTKAQDLEQRIYKFLGKDLSASLKIKLKFVYNDQILIRLKDTPSLFDKSKEERRRLMQGAFLRTFDLKSKDSICLVIDDITTTGTTLLEAHKTLNFPRTVLVSACGRISDENFT